MTRADFTGTPVGFVSEHAMAGAGGVPSDLLRGADSKEGLQRSQLGSQAAAGASFSEEGGGQLGSEDLAATWRDISAGLQTLTQIITTDAGRRAPSDLASLPVPELSAKASGGASGGPSMGVGLQSNADANSLPGSRSREHSSSSGISEGQRRNSISDSTSSMGTPLASVSDADVVSVSQGSQVSSIADNESTTDTETSRGLALGGEESSTAWTKQYGRWILLSDGILAGAAVSGFKEARRVMSGGISLRKQAKALAFSKDSSEEVRSDYSAEQEQLDLRLVNLRTRLLPVVQSGIEEQEARLRDAQAALKLELGNLGSDHLPELEGPLLSNMKECWATIVEARKVLDDVHDFIEVPGPLDGGDELSRDLKALVQSAERQMECAANIVAVRWKEMLLGELGGRESGESLSALRGRAAAVYHFLVGSTRNTLACGDLKDAIVKCAPAEEKKSKSLSGRSFSKSKFSFKNFFAKKK